MRNRRFGMLFAASLIIFSTMFWFSMNSNDQTGHALAAEESGNDVSGKGAADRQNPAFDHPVVVGFDRFYSDDKANKADGGTLLLGELNCVSCHRADSAVAEAIATKPAPLLGAAADRIQIDYLRKFIADPHHTKPGTTMPGLFDGVSKSDRAAQTEALLHYLVSMRQSPLGLTAPDGSAVFRGEALFHSVGCVGCHRPHRELSDEIDEDMPLASGPSVPLGALEKKYSIASLSMFLLDPLKIRSGGRMPQMGLSQIEASDLASYLLKEIDAPYSLSYAYYEGTFDKLPDFTKLLPKYTGQATTMSIGVRKRNDHFAITFDSFLNIAAAGDYKFYTKSDDGSQLFLDNALVVDNDNVHAPTVKSGLVKLAVGKHPLRVTFFENGGGEELTVEFEGPGIGRQVIPSSMMMSSKKPPPEKKQFVVDASLAAKGKKLFASAGCASCHQLQAGEPAASDLTAKPLGQLSNFKAGCLSETPEAGRPHYRLNALQQTAITAALRRLKTTGPAKLSAKERIDHTMTRLNCFACHRRDDKGGVTRDRNEFFISDDKDLGDEGRIPPLLTGVGDKLRDQWLTAVMLFGGISRDYMKAKMPQFGKEMVGHLVHDFAEVDRRSEGLAKSSDSPKDAKKAGRTLVGKKGLTCISCHSFNRHRSLGIQAMDLANMSGRLRADWFFRYMRDPQPYRPGTRMPSAWPNGKSTKPDILDGDVDRQLHAVWAYLSDGRRAKTPIGLASQSMELIVGGEALIYRNFIQGAGPRAIAVGYPEEVNLAFDANSLRLALVWQGAFMNASKHWQGRGAGFLPPAGENVVTLIKGAPFAQLADNKSPWPAESGKTAGYQFRGYRLDQDRRPTFKYDFGKIHITDFPEGIEQAAGGSIRRTITLSSSDKVDNLWFRAATGKIKIGKDGLFHIGDTLTMRFETAGNTKPVVRKMGDNGELLVPVVFKDGKAQIVQELHW